MTLARHRSSDLPCTVTQLGDKNSPCYVGFSAWAIQAMKLAGLIFTAGRKTTRRSILNFMQQNPDFRASDFYGPTALSAEKLAEKYPAMTTRALERMDAARRARSKTAQLRVAARADKSGEQSSRHG